MGSVLRSVLSATEAESVGENAHGKGVPHCDESGYHGTVTRSRPTNLAPHARRSRSGAATRAVGGDYSRVGRGGRYGVAGAENARQAGEVAAQQPPKPKETPAERLARLRAAKAAKNGK